MPISPGAIPPAIALAGCPWPEITDSRIQVRQQFLLYRSLREQFPYSQQQSYDLLLANRFKSEFPPQLLPWGQFFFPHYFTHPASQMHLWLAEMLQWKHKESQTHEAIIAPRSGAKTTWTSKLYTLFCVCHGLEHYILLIGDSSEQSWQNLAAVKKELVDNEALGLAYPHACGQGPRWNESYIITRNDIKVEALGTRKKVRGRTHGPHRPGLIIIDDLENDDGVQSPTQREKVFKWLNRALLPCGGEDCNVLFVGTALHPEDALQKIKQTPGWRLRSFPSLVHEPQRQDLWDAWRAIYRSLAIDPRARASEARTFYEAHRTDMDQGAVLLWPEKEPLYDLMVWREDKGEVAFQAEKQGNAAATGATEFGSQLFTSSIWFDVWPQLTLKAMALDPSKGRHERNDYSAYVWGGLSEDGNIYVDADIERRDASQVVTDGIQIYRRLQPHVFGIETVMFLDLFADLFDAESRRLSLLIPMTQITPHSPKLVRIRQLTPFLKSGRIKFHAGSRGAELLVEQLKWFPTGKHDDGPDALHMLIDLLRSMSAGPLIQDEVIVT